METLETLEVLLLTWYNQSEPDTPFRNEVAELLHKIELKLYKKEKINIMEAQKEDWPVCNGIPQPNTNPTPYGYWTCTDNGWVWIPEIGK